MPLVVHKPSTQRKSHREQRAPGRKILPGRRTPALVPSRSLLFSMYPPLPFAPHPRRYCLPSPCRSMTLADTWSTPCNDAITHKFHYKFKYRAQADNIPSGDTLEVDG